MVLSKFENDWLVHLALFTCIYDVHQIHALKNKSIGALAEHLVH